MHLPKRNHGYRAQAHIRAAPESIHYCDGDERAAGSGVRPDEGHHSREEGAGRHDVDRTHAVGGSACADTAKPRGGVCDGDEVEGEVGVDADIHGGYIDVGQH